MANEFDPQGTFTFYNSLSPSLAADILQLSTGDQRRIERYSSCWAFYNGQHWEFDRDDGDPLITINYIRAIARKHQAALVRKGFMFDMDLPFRDTLMPRVSAIWEQNGGDNFRWRVAESGSVGGDHFVLVSWREATPIEVQLRSDINGYVTLELLNSSQCFPTWDKVKPDEMESCLILKHYYHPKYDEEGTDTGELEVRTIKTHIFKDKIEEELPDPDDPTGKTILRRTKDNILGEVSVVHWANVPNSGDWFGVSDVLPLIPIQREYNEKHTDVSDIINYHASPITIVYGAKITAVDRSAKTIWSNLPVDARVENLAAPSDLGASNQYLDRLRTSMHEVGNVPEGSLGSSQFNAETGEVLVSRMQPLLEHRDAKIAAWKSGVRRVNYFILRMLNLMSQVELPKDRCAVTGGIIIAKTEPKSNALGQVVQVVTGRVVVEYDSESMAPRVLDAEEAVQLVSAGQSDQIVEVPAMAGVLLRRVPSPHSRPANPIKCLPVFPEALPKDQLAQLQRLTQIATMKIVDRRWLMQQIPDIDNDEIPDLLRRVEQETIMDKIIDAALGDNAIDMTDAEMLRDLVESGGDVKRVMHLLAESRLKAEGKAREDEERSVNLQAKASAANKVNVGGVVTEPQKVTAGKKRRGEK